jgi:hypothetical protein
VNAATNSVLDSRDLSSFHDGEYVEWNLSGHVKLKLTNLSGGSNTVASALFFDSGAPRVTQMAYDWRDRLIATKQGVETSESTSVNRPIFYVELNNLGETLCSERYDGDTLSITTDSDNDGVPDRPSSGLTGKTGFDIDDQGRVYRTKSYKVTGGTPSDPITSQSWYDRVRAVNCLLDWRVTLGISILSRSHRWQNSSGIHGGKSPGVG